MYKLNSEKMFFDIADNQAIVINHVTGMYYGFNYIGSYVLEQLINGSSVEDVSAAIKSADGCPEDFDSKVSDFVSKLAELEIIIEADVEKKNPEQPADVVFSEGFDLAVNEYDEAAELILADPIHDVEEGQGWPVMKS